MKILNIMQGTHLGGMEQSSFTLMKILREKGHSLQVLSLTPRGPLADLLEESGIPCEGSTYHGKGGWRSFPALRKTLRRFRCEALLMTGHNLSAMLALGSLGAGTRVLAQHFHHSGVKAKWEWRLIYHVACRKFHAITFPSAFIRDEAIALYPPVASIAHLIPNPIPLSPAFTAEERERARAWWGISGDQPVVGNAGWLIPRKRYDLFLQVARKVSDSFPGAVFMIAGDGPERERLEKQARSLGLSGQVRWVGWRQDLQDFYRALDVLLFNSDWDAMGMTPLEAMSCGIPVVASVLHGGLGEVMKDGCTGRFFTEHDLEGVSEAVLALLRDPKLRQELGTAGRRRIAETSDPVRCAAAYENLLKGSGLWAL